MTRRERFQALKQGSDAKALAVKLGAGAVEAARNGEAYKARILAFMASRYAMAHLFPDTPAGFPVELTR